MARLFGTDGIRGKANSDLSCEIAFRLGQAVVNFEGSDILVGKDTRISGDMLESALIAGITSCGGNAHLAGIIPTPAVAHLVRSNNLSGGVMISASHNPPEYNGLKVFDSRGLKLPDKVEDEIEEFILNGGSASDKLPAGDKVGKAFYLENATDEYVSFIVDSVLSQDITFAGLKVALDAGHGAAFDTSYLALTKLGAGVVAINRDFSGTDINVKCGSTHLEPLAKLIQDSGADIGIAHDGDADRVMMLSSKGIEIDGDIMLAVLAFDMKSRDVLRNNTVVGTVMSNMGLKVSLKEQGIDFVATKVGDRYVLEEMLNNNYAIGGEQSGHIIMLDYNTTGDGLMSAVQFLAAVQRAGKTVDEAISFYEKFPQVLINVEVSDKNSAMSDESVQEMLQRAEEELGETGRVLLRPSGTEPVIRVMVEAQDKVLAQDLAEQIAAKLK
jgi:phosphoglucosamine mutase